MSKTLTDHTAAASLTDDDLFYVVQGGNGRKATGTQIKTFVSTLVTSLMDLKSGTDCSANPNYPSALKGDAYWVTVAGKIGGGSGVDVAAGDLILAVADNAGGTQASVGTSWIVIERNLTGTPLLASNNLSDVANPATARDNIDAAPDLLVPSNITGTSYTILATDRYVAYRLTNAAQVTVTVPLNATTAVPIGSRIRLIVLGAGGLVIAKGDVSITLISQDDAVDADQYAIVELHKTGTDEWALLGNFYVP